MQPKEKPKPSRKSKSAIAEMATRTLLDSRRLFYFFHVAKAGSFTGAETSLDVAQSAMTRQIQQLESDIGVQLLQRTGRGVLLTSHGEIMFKHAEAILGNMSEAIDEIDRSTKDPGGRLSIATPPSFSSLYMPEVIRRLLVSMPSIRLTLLEASTGQVHDYLASGEVDLAVVLHAPNSQKVVLKKISSEPLCLIVNNKHPLASQKSVTRAELANVEMILPVSTHGSRRLVEQYFFEGGLPLDAALQIDSLPITKSLIAQGPRFSSILPERSCRDEIASGQFRALVLKPSLHRTLHLARMRDRAETPFAKAMAREISEVLLERFKPLGI